MFTLYFFISDLFSKINYLIPETLLVNTKQLMLVKKIKAKVPKYEVSFNYILNFFFGQLYL